MDQLPHGGGPGLCRAALAVTPHGTRSTPLSPAPPGHLLGLLTTTLPGAGSQALKRGSFQALPFGGPRSTAGPRGGRTERKSLPSGRSTTRPTGPPARHGGPAQHDLPQHDHPPPNTGVPPDTTPQHDPPTGPRPPRGPDDVTPAHARRDRASSPHDAAPRSGGSPGGRA